MKSLLIDIAKGAGVGLVYAAMLCALLAVVVVPGIALVRYGWLPPGGGIAFMLVWTCVLTGMFLAIMRHIEG